MPHGEEDSRALSMIAAAVILLAPVVQFVIVATTNKMQELLVCCTLLAAMAVVQVYATVSSKNVKQLVMTMVVPLIASAAAVFLVVYEGPIKPEPERPNRAQCHFIAKPSSDWVGSTFEGCPHHINASFYFVHDSLASKADTQWPRRAFRASRNARMGKLKSLSLHWNRSSGQTVRACWAARCTP